MLAGLSVAFDASCEEMWLAWRHGGCLVPAPRSVVRTGPDLVTWLAQRRVSVVSTVPTLASLWPGGSPPGVRLLVLGGEVCPGGLAGRLTRPGTEVWNTYGPTEATVVSCGARLSGGGPVPIGLPLDGWRLAVVHPASGQPVRWGEAGELVIGGTGVARYLDARRDAVDFRPLEALRWERAYHTGDLVRADPAGLIYLGRADTQVKIRGYRIEPGEIEAVLERLPGIGLAAVTTYERQPGVVELAGYYTIQDRAAAPDRQAMHDYLRNHLPRHMVPAYLEQLPVMPLLPDGKADRKHLPEPTKLRPPRGRPGLCRAGHPWREGARRSAGRTPGTRAGVGGQPVLRRPGPELPAGRALLRPGQGTGGLAAAVGQGRLPASDHPEPGRRGHRATFCSWRCDEPAAARRGVADRYRAVCGAGLARPWATRSSTSRSRSVSCGNTGAGAVGAVK